MLFYGVNFTFFPQHFLGIIGMPRRYIEYPDIFNVFHTISRIGRILSFYSCLFFIYIKIESSINHIIRNFIVNEDFNFILADHEHFDNAFFLKRTENYSFCINKLKKIKKKSKIALLK